MLSPVSLFLMFSFFVDTKHNSCNFDMNINKLQHSSKILKNPCCNYCKNPLFKFYSIDRKHGFCGEACLNPKYYNLYKIFEPNLEKSESFDKMSCFDNNFKFYNTTVEHKIQFLKVNVDLYTS